MKEILTTNGMTVFVDDEDYDLVSKYSWRACQGTNNPNWYAVTYTAINGKEATYMHRLILGLTGSRPWVDHINGNGLDNQRRNLRTASASQNSANCRKTSKARTSPYKGVYWEKNTKAWRASIRVNRKLHDLGHYKDPILAARAYDKAAREYFGEFAKPNFSD